MKRVYGLASTVERGTISSRRSRAENLVFARPQTCHKVLTVAPEVLP